MARKENTEIIYPYLAHAIRVRKMPLWKMAVELGMDQNTLSRKLHGKSEIRLSEAFSMKRVLDVKWSLDKLFYVIDDDGLGGKESGVVA